MFNVVISMYIASAEGSNPTAPILIPFLTLQGKPLLNTNFIIFNNPYEILPSSVPYPKSYYFKTK